MAMCVLRRIADDLQSTEYILLMMDACTDVANHKQVNVHTIFQYYNVSYCLPLVVLVGSCCIAIGGQ